MSSLPKYIVEKLNSLDNDTIKQINSIIYDNSHNRECTPDDSIMKLFNDLYMQIPFLNIKNFYETKFTEIKQRVHNLFEEKDVSKILQIAILINKKCSDLSSEVLNCSNYKKIIHEVQPDETDFDISKMNEKTITSLLPNKKQSLRLKRIIILFTLNAEILGTSVLDFFRMLFPSYNEDIEIKLSESLEKWSGKQFDTITIADIYNKFKEETRELLLNIALPFVRDNYYNQIQKKKNIEKVLNNFLNNYDIDRSISMNDPSSSNTYFSFLYISDKSVPNSNFIDFHVFNEEDFEIREEDYSINRMDYQINFEQADSVYYPPFNIFTIYDKDMAFFTFFHELGHYVASNFGNVSVEYAKIIMNEDIVGIHGNQYKSRKYMRLFKDALSEKILLLEHDTDNKEKLELLNAMNEDSKLKNATQIDDLCADYISSNIFFDYLSKKYEDVPKCILRNYISVMTDLGHGDNVHMDTPLRVKLNILLTDKIRDFFIKEAADDSTISADDYISSKISSKKFKQSDIDRVVAVAKCNENDDFDENDAQTYLNQYGTADDVITTMGWEEC